MKDYFAEQQIFTQRMGEFVRIEQATAVPQYHKLSDLMSPQVELFVIMSYCGETQIKYSIILCKNQKGSNCLYQKERFTYN